MLLENFPWRSQIQALAHESPDQEICGFVAGDRLFPSPNISDKPAIRFATDPSVWYLANNYAPISCIYHSHVNDRSNVFSTDDVKFIKEQGIQAYLFCLPYGRECFYDPAEQLPYLKRPWNYGLTDCYALFRDYYARELGIELDDFEREDIKEWESPSCNKFVDNAVNQGFKWLGQDGIALRNHDMILMQYLSPNPNHIAVVYDADKSLILHHRFGRLSEISVYGSDLQKNTTHIYRHGSLI